MIFRFSRRSRSIVVGLLCSVALSVVLSACSSGSTGSAPNGQTGTGAGPAQEVKVDMGDFFYAPNEITVKAGTVRFVLTNVGATAHRFSVTGDGVSASSKNVAAGGQGTVEVTMPAGSYKLGCTLGDHEARGSIGKLTVQ